MDLGCVGRTVEEYGLRVDLAIAVASGSGFVLSTVEATENEIGEMSIRAFLGSHQNSLGIHFSRRPVCHVPLTNQGSKSSLKLDKSFGSFVIIKSNTDLRMT